jgi:hypothetical protein
MEAKLGGNRDLRQNELLHGDNLSSLIVIVIILCIKLTKKATAAKNNSLQMEGMIP